MATKVTAMSAPEAGKPWQKVEIELPPLVDDRVEISIESCGICHSDMSMWNNDWGMSAFPFVGGHEGFGTVTAVGKNVKSLKVGQKAGLGWDSGYCNACNQCRKGDNNLCGNKEMTIVQRHGCFAQKVHANADAVVAIPEGFEGDHVGPLFCGGITVFTPVLEYAKPEMKVGVIGIGGLGSMAVQMLAKWGCHVTAFTSSEAKRKTALELGAHRTVSSTDGNELAGVAGQFDLIVSTVNVTMKWDAIIGALGPRGRLHLVGATMEPIPVAAFGLLFGHKCISGSPVGSPAAIATMLDFCSRHTLKPQVQVFKFEQINEAFEEMKKNPQGRIVLKW